MRMQASLVLGLAAFVVGAGPALAQDFTGTWDITAQYNTSPGDQVDEIAVDCLYAGTAMITGTEGPATLNLTGTDPAGNEGLCEASLTGTVTVTDVQGTSIAGTITDPVLGVADFSGTEQTMVRGGGVLKQATNVSGTVQATQGPLAGNSSGGAFNALIRQPMPTLPAPALGLLLFLLVAGGGWILLRRRPPRPAPG